MSQVLLTPGLNSSGTLLYSGGKQVQGILSVPGTTLEGMGGDRMAKMVSVLGCPEGTGTQRHDSKLVWAGETLEAWTVLLS